MSKREDFSNVTRTYKTRAKAVKIIDKLIDDNYHWTILATEDGRFVPHIRYNSRDCELTMHYFIKQGCCVTIG